jgi:pyroglutamyl-peptidase
MKYTRNIFVIFIILIFIVPIFPTGITYSNYNYNLGFASKNSTVLVTGFGPFSVYDINPSQLIVEELDGQFIDGVEIIGIVLPVDFDLSVENITKAIDDYTPKVLISTGLSPRAKKMNIEKVGINLKMYPRDEKKWFFPRRLDPCGPLFRLSSLDTKEIVSEINDAGIASRQSYYAGYYICNAVLYGALGFIKECELPIKTGFIHVPLMSSQDPNGMELETMVEAVKIAIKTSLI